jgi:hypothetical protein
VAACCVPDRLDKAPTATLSTAGSGTAPSAARTRRTPRQATSVSAWPGEAPRTLGITRCAHEMRHWAWAREGRVSMRPFCGMGLRASIHR